MGKKGVAWMFHFQNDTQNFILSPNALRKIAKVFCFYVPLISQLTSRSYGWSILWVTWKIWFSPIQAIFHGKNGPNSPNFKGKKKKSKLPNFNDKFPAGCKNIERFLYFFFFSYLVCSHNWLNHLMDNHNFSYITKLIIINLF